VFNDLRFALRTLGRSKGFTTAALLTLALGIGANTAIFSVVNGIILRPLPYNNPDELVMIASAFPEQGIERFSMSQPDVRSIQEEARFLEAAAGYSTGQLTLTGFGDAESIRSARVTDGLLEVFDEEPVIGRDIRGEENVPNGPRVVLIGHAFWQERLGGDFDAVGSSLQIFGEPYEIIGVAPSGFNYPQNTELWIPGYVNTEGCNRDCHFLRVIARLAGGASVQVAREEANALSLSLQERFPVLNHGKLFNLETLEERVTGNVRPALLVLFGAVGLLLLIACSNVANLLLVRASNRTGEIAVRSALGASRSRIVIQLMSEAAVLALAASVLGIVVAQGGLAWLLRLAPSTIPRLDSVTLDPTVIAFTFGTAVFVTVLFGLAPAFRLSGTPVGETLNQGGRRGTSGRAHDRWRSGLLVSEVALSLILLFGAGALIRSFSKLSAVELGFETQHDVTFNISLPRNDYDVDGAVRFFETLEREIEGVPGVENVASIYGSPLTNYGFITSIGFLDRPAPPPGQEPNMDIRVVSPDFLETLGIPLVAGRVFETIDRDGGVRAAIVSRSMATQFYEGQNPIGQQITVDANLGYGSDAPWTIVGIAEDTRSNQLTSGPAAEVYLPHAQMGGRFMTVHVRIAPDVRDVLPAIRARLGAVDPNVPLRDVEMLRTTVDRQLGPTRFYMTLLTTFAALAVALAAIGLYGVVAYLVSGRTREIGIRMAMGAEARDVLRLVLAQGIRPALLGLAVGIGGVFVGARVLESMLYEIEPTDPSTVVLTTLLLLVVVVCAILLPARRASQIAPVEALRNE
jgi:putative ABC transport system permease protein